MKKTNPPKLAEWLLCRMMMYNDCFFSSGDFREEYLCLAEERGRMHANLWYWSQVLMSVIPYSLYSIIMGTAMLKNYLKIAFRNILKSKTVSLINISGLTLGLACSFIIILYVSHELSFDKYHEKAERIYRVISWDNNLSRFGALTPYLLKEEAFPEVPEFDLSARMMYSEVFVKSGNSYIRESSFVKADESIFSVFTLPFVTGDPETALKSPYSAVLSEEGAEKYFGNEDPVGKTLNIKIETGKFGPKKYDLKVTGIIKNIPSNSHLRNMNIIVPMSAIEWGYQKFTVSKKGPTRGSIPYFQSWFSQALYTYVVLPESADPQTAGKKITGNVDNRMQKKYKNHKAKIKSTREFHLQPILDIHLNSTDILLETGKAGSILRIKLFTLLANLILFIAIVNYIVLSTARSAARAREIGIRKVVGAKRMDLIKQIMGESVLISLISFPLALTIAYFSLPVINRLLSTNLTINIVDQWKYIAGFSLITVFTGIVSGGYISIVLSSFKPLEVIRNTFKAGSSKAGFKNILVIFQLIIFIVLIICTSVIHRQINFIRHDIELGFNKNNVVSLFINNNNMVIKNSFKAFKRELLKFSSIESVSGTSNDPPANNFPAHKFYSVKSKRLKMSVFRPLPHGFSIGEIDGPVWEMESSFIDRDYIKTMGLELIAGTTFPEKTRFDRAVIVNETFIKDRGIKDPVGKSIRVTGFQRKVVGVIKDFHTHSLYEKIRPLQLIYGEKYINQITIRMTPGETEDALKVIEEKWQKFSPEFPMELSFLDESLEKMYLQEYKIFELLGYFTIMAVFIACLGLFGMSKFISEQRTKEIGIRKVMGASVTRIVNLVSRRFIILVVTANIAGWPVGWYVSGFWLENFAYRIEPGRETFILTGVLSLALTLFTIGFQTIKAARKNPVDTLRYE